MFEITLCKTQNILTLTCVICQHISNDFDINFWCFCSIFWWNYVFITITCVVFVFNRRSFQELKIGDVWKLYWFV